MTTHMIYSPLNMRAFNRWAGERGLIKHGSFDEGHAMHILLNSMFGKSILQPFRLFASERHTKATLYSYADIDSEALKDIADGFATPDCQAVINPRKLLSKPIRTEYNQGQRLGFDIRVRPIKRLKTALPNHPQGTPFKPGSEVDAYLVERSRSHPDGWKDESMRPDPSEMSREKIYLRWMAERLGGAAQIDEEKSHLASYRRNRVIRGDGRGPEGPDVVLQGDLIVGDPSEFSDRLCNGIGRHKAYGYGMLLLRPPNKPKLTL